jgi:hypothetical protein
MSSSYVADAIRAAAPQFGFETSDNVVAMETVA